MKSVIIKLDTIVKVKEFVSITNRYAGKIEVTEGRCTVDGKSIMGILSLDLKKALNLNIKTGENVPMFIQELKPYIVV